MLHIHANVYARPTTVTPGPRLRLRGTEVEILCGENGGPPLFNQPLPATFEQVQAALMKLDRCDCEPDGFFLLTGGKHETFWRLNGHMHEYTFPDLGVAMHRVELNGECPELALDDVLGALRGDESRVVPDPGEPSHELVFELVQEGVTLSESDFREYARRS